MPVNNSPIPVEKIAPEVSNQMSASAIRPGPIVTEVAQASDFRDAKEEHQNYLQKHPAFVAAISYGLIGNCLN